MARQLRIKGTDLFYHIFNRGNFRQAIFEEDEDYKTFLDLAFEIAEEKELIIICYTLIPNHFHFVDLTMRANISEYMQRLTTNYVQKINKKKGRSGHLMQGRFKSIIIDSDNYLLEISRYLHLNSVKAGLCKRPENYKWSSYRQYIGLEKKKYPIEDKLILEYFSEDTKKGRIAYRKFVEEKMNEISEYNLPPTYKDIVYGDEEFAIKVLEKSNRREEKIDGRKRRWKDRELNKSDEEKYKIILKEVKKYYKIQNKLDNKTEKGIKVKHILIYLLRELTDLSYARIGELIGPTARTTIHSAYDNIKKKMKESKIFKKEIDYLEDKFSDYSDK